VFWERFEDNTGLNRQDAMDLWRKLGFKARRWLRFVD